MLVGRDAEMRRIERVIVGAGEGRSGALVIRGEAGIGKTALLDEAVARSALRTLRCTGVESEHDLPFAALHQLLRPLTGLIERLPDPQAAALQSAFGLGTDPVRDRLLLGIATLNLIAEAADDGPLLCVVDDVQWVDEPSAQALLFCARRLEAEGVVLLLAVRDEPGGPVESYGLPELRLAPLADDAARALAAEREVSPRSLDSVVRQAAGNPLALLELSPERTEGRGATGVEWSFRARIARLPPETRSLLLLATLDESEEPRTWHELSKLAPPTADVHAAVSEGLVVDGDEVRFRHPLVRSAVHGTASRAEIAEAHRLLAGVSSDALGRASHLAAAADAPDEDVAAELESAAAGAARRGAFASAAAAYDRAGALSATPDDRARRLARSAQAWLDAGRGDVAATLANEALAGAHAPGDRAALLAVRGTLALQEGTPDEAYEHFSAAARAVSTADPEFALVLYGSALAASLFGGWPERVFAEAHAFVEALPATDTPERTFLETFLGGATALLRGAGEEAQPLLRRAVTAGDDIHDARNLVWVGLAALYLGDVAAAREHYLKAAAAARNAGSFTVLPQALLTLAQLYIALRAFAQAEDCAREGIELAHQLGQPNFDACFSAVLVRVLAAQGKEDECREVAERALRIALARNLGIAVSEARLGLAELEVGLGDGAAACALIEAIPLALSRIAATPDYVDAALLAGEPARATAAVEALATYSEQGQDPYFLALLARCRAQLAPDAGRADELFQEALRQHTRTGFPYDRALAELAYGEFLRRNGRRVEARLHLRNALDTFEGLGTPLRAARARAELEATGITARRRDPSTLDTLTPQELRIARLVGAGASNREVAAQLFLSPKTVEYHLRKVFLKLGITSRVELARQELEPIPADAPAN